MNKFDVIVIGAGSGGLTVAITLSGAGKSVLLVEKDKPGGECTHSGCIPSKALLHAARSGKTGAESLDYTKKIIDKIYKEETPEKLESHGITYLKGQAVFTDKNRLEIDGAEHEFKKAVISTGSSPRMIPIEGLDKDMILTNQNLFDLDDIPKKLLILGTGPIGIEMADAFSSMGSIVTMVSIDKRFAETEEPEISDLLKTNFEKRGIKINLNTYIQKVSGNIAFFEVKGYDSDQKSLEVSFDKILIAIGRVPNIPDGLDNAGIEFSKNGIKINSGYRTTNRNVYAIGDVSGILKFTHTANEGGRYVSKKIIAPFLPLKNKKNVPKVTYSSPEIASVGISWDDSVAKYRDSSVLKISVPFSEIDRAKTDQAEDGLLIMTVKRLTGKILGANIYGKRAGELLAPITLAMDNSLSMWKLNSSVFPYPSYSEILKKASDKFALASIKNLKTDLLGFFKRNILKVIALGFWLVIISCFYTYKEMSGLSFRDMTVNLYHFVTGTLWGPIIYMLAYTIRPIIFFPATLMTMLSGALFGLPLGILYTIIGENGSANLAYAIGRFFGKDAHLGDSSLVWLWVEKLREKPFISVLIMRFIYLPFDLTNYLSGIVQVRWGAYALATFIGILPGVTTFVGFGAALKPTLENTTSGDVINLSSIETNGPVLIFSIVLFIASLLLAKYFKKKHA